MSSLKSCGETSNTAPKERKSNTADTPPPSAGKVRRNRGPPGVVWTWGGGDKGCLGVGDEEGRMLPEQVAGGPESVRQVQFPALTQVSVLPLLLDLLDQCGICPSGCCWFALYHHALSWREGLAVWCHMRIWV